MAKALAPRMTVAIKADSGWRARSILWKKPLDLIITGCLAQLESWNDLSEACS